eukprot:gene389-6918_t
MAVERVDTEASRNSALQRNTSLLLLIRNAQIDGEVVQAARWRATPARPTAITTE